jgi:hypothetical protein
VVGGDAFASLFRRGVRDVRAAVFQRDQDTFTLTVADAGGPSDRPWVAKNGERLTRSTPRPACEITYAVGVGRRETRSSSKARHAPAVLREAPSGLDYLAAPESTRG